MRQLHLLLATGLLLTAAALTAPAVYAASPALTGVAQSGGLTDTLTGATASVTPTRATAAATATPRGTPSPTAAAAQVVTLTLPLTLTGPLTAAVPATASATALPAATAVPTATAVATATATTSTTTAAPAGVIAGTVLANRTQALVRFFFEGATYDLAALRSTGLQLQRPTVVINLFNCDASLGEDQTGCFWDPYLLQRDGFYEIVLGKDAGELKSLILREAGSPPDNQVWIQNRAGRDEEVYFGTQMRSVPQGGVEQFSVESGGVGIFYLRTCVTTQDGASVCEWAANSAQPGGYYALVDDARAGSIPGSTISNLTLQPILAAGPAALGAATTLTVTGAATVTSIAADAPQAVCRLAVPALNVRSGPGLEFEIVKKVRSSDVEIASVIVTGRTEAGDWLRVDERVSPGGWVIAGSEYLTCDGDILALPVVPASELPPTPTPLPLDAIPTAPDAVAPPDASAAPVDAGAAVTETAPAASAPAGTLPAGTAQITVLNSFDRQMIFTLDQRYRLETAPSQMVLEPGQSTTMLVFAGLVPFTASSPWQGLSGNTAVTLAEGETRTLYLVFYYDENEKAWYLAPP